MTAKENVWSAIFRITHWQKHCGLGCEPSTASACKLQHAHTEGMVLAPVYLNINGFLMT